MRVLTTLFTLLAIVAAFQPLPVHASSVAAEDATELLWFIEIDGDRGAVRANARSAGIKFTDRFDYDTLWRGMSVRASVSEALALKSVPGVVNVYPVEDIQIAPISHDDSMPQLVSALAMSGADVVQEAGFDGTGIKVGVIDSGIDFDHPDLGGCFGPGCRVAYGYDFVGDLFDSGAGIPPAPDAIPDDCPGPAFVDPARVQAGGHGTHVAGIVGASGNIATGGARGVAPGVTFGAYRVFGCNGSTTADVMIAAMERAYQDGMDVVNMSIGASFQWPQYPTAVAANELVKRGVVVVTSFGNSGASGLYSGSAPGVAENVIAVGAVNNTHTNNQYFTVPAGAVPYNPATAAPPPPTSGTVALARTGTAASTADACNTNPPAAGSLSGKVALIQRGTCSFHEKSLNAQNAGAIGVVIYNNTTGLQSITVAGAPAITVPVVSITQGAGLFIDAQLANGPYTMTWQEGFISQPVAGGGTSSSFSSYGLSPDLSVKPDLTAPGGGIRSTYPLGFGGGYAVSSGTSMASPHVAGNVAQLLQAEPGLSPQAVRERLQNSASAVLWWGNPGLGFLDQVHRQGAGHVRIDRALAVTTEVTPSRIALGETSRNQRANLRLRNTSDHTVTYTIHHEPALATGPDTFAVSAWDGFASTDIRDETLTLKKGQHRMVRVDFEEPEALPDNSLYGGYIVFTPDDGSPDVRVPYAGFKGDYQSIQVLGDVGFGFPWLAQLSGGSYFNRPDGATYTMVGNDVPYILFNAAHQSRRITMNVRGVGKGRKNWHHALDLEYFRRNAGNNPATLPDSFFAVPWDGTTFNPSGRKQWVVPDGDYVIELEVQKAEGRPNETETWVSPVITIARP